MLLEQLHGHSDRGPSDPSADGFPPGILFLLEPFDHPGIITAVSTTFKRLLQEPEDVTVLVRVVWRMVQHLQGHSVQRVVCSDDDIETGVVMQQTSPSSAYRDIFPWWQYKCLGRPLICIKC